ncbi:MAG: glutamate--cysteine ligase [Ferrimonas sp.]
MSDFNQALAILSLPQWQSALTQLNRGIERETLRIDEACRLALDPHHPDLGSALTHPWITTDFSESLLELITPVYQDPDKLLNHLADTHTYVLKHIGQQRLWPLSMPCVLSPEQPIPIAQYGHSHVGRMKTIYRIGLHNRYGSEMQAIAGLHFNFSIADELWPAFGVSVGDQAAVSARYFALIRYFRRHTWVLAYLFGASPSLCKSFLQQPTDLPFEEHDNTLYLPYATSLRMSDLGYTNSAQEALSVSVDGIDEYVRDLQHAISVPSAEYAALGIKVDGQYRQLNSNVLQIENELYAPIRPKRTIHSGETPSQALARGGVEYIEVRALDINPFSALGIERSQVLLLDLFLLDGLLQPSPRLSAADEQQNQANFTEVVLDGRRPNKMLMDDGQPRALSAWLMTLFERWQQLAPILDAAHGDMRYQQALAQWLPCVQDPNATLSAKVLATSLAKGHGQWACDLATEHRHELLNRPYAQLTEVQLVAAAEQSKMTQLAIEGADRGSFDDYLSAYWQQSLRR